METFESSAYKFTVISNLVFRMVCHMTPEMESQDEKSGNFNMCRELDSAQLFCFAFFQISGSTVEHLLSEIAVGSTYKIIESFSEHYLRDP